MADSRQPTTQAVIVTTVVVGVVSELLRWVANPDFFASNGIKALGLVAGAILVNCALQVWSQPPSMSRLIVSAFFSQVGMPFLVGITVLLLVAVWKAIWQWLMTLFGPPANPAQPAGR